MTSVAAVADATAVDVALGVAMACTAALSGVLLLRRNGSARADVEVFHLAMGSAMAAMLWHRFPAGVAAWSALAFAVAAAWFGAKAVGRGRARLLDVQHALASLAMVVMAASAAGTSDALGAAAGRSGHEHAVMGGGGLTTMLVLALAACAAANAARSARDPLRGDVHAHRGRWHTGVVEVVMLAGMGLMALGSA